MPDRAGGGFLNTLLLSLRSALFIEGAHHTLPLPSPPLPPLLSLNTPACLSPMFP